MQDVWVLSVSELRVTKTIYTISIPLKFIFLPSLEKMITSGENEGRTSLSNIPHQDCSAATRV